MNERTREGRRLLGRWVFTLVCLLLMLTWATCRMNQARLSLEAANDAGGASTDSAPTIDYWTCTMHPEVHEAAPGTCPICGMELVARYAGSDAPGVPPASGDSNAHSSGSHRRLYMCTMPECNDTPSEDPNSRCPVCGMKREPIGMTDTGDASDVELALNTRAQKLAEVATEQVAPRRLFRHIRTVGKVGYDETRHKMVTAWMAGRIDRLYADYSGKGASAASTTGYLSNKDAYGKILND